MCSKVTSQYKTEVSEKIVQAAIIAFSRYEYDRARLRSKEDFFYAISENSIRELKEQALFTKSEDLVKDSQKFYIIFCRASE
jgi:hypothetical protein